MSIAYILHITVDIYSSWCVQGEGGDWHPPRQLNQLKVGGGTCVEVGVKLCQRLSCGNKHTVGMIIHQKAGQKHVLEKETRTISLSSQKENSHFPGRGKIHQHLQKLLDGRGRVVGWESLERTRNLFRSPLRQDLHNIKIIGEWGRDTLGGKLCLGEPYPDMWSPEWAVWCCQPLAAWWMASKLVSTNCEA